MKTIELTYRSLLADVASLSGLSEIRGSRYDLQWCLNEAPKLEKHILGVIERGEILNLELFPDGLRRLAGRSISDAISLRYLRQLLLFSYKAQTQHSNETETKSYSRFDSTNREVGEWGERLKSQSPILLNLARRHVQSVLSRFDKERIIPCHGPGASTTPKERWSTWYSSIERTFPYSDWFACYFNREHVGEWGECMDKDIEAKLIAVPKDSRGPRLICVHPAESIWIQQGVRRELERVIALSRDQYGPWPCGHVLFDDQSVNGQLALSSSETRLMATLDLEEASDRLSERLVAELFGSYYEFFDCCRAKTYVTPQGAYAPVDNRIHSYAPMGNATTFPVQSLVFWAICVSSLQYRGAHRPSEVYVFGDDILVPSCYARLVIADLESFGLKVNVGKTFVDSQFRESCGVDAFKGINVTPVRWKCSPDANNLLELQSLSDIAMRLRLAGYEEAATTAYAVLRSKLKSRTGCDLFKTNNVKHGAICEYTKRESEVWRDAYWHRDTQQFVSPVYTLGGSPKRRTFQGWNLVLESITSLAWCGRSNVPDRALSRRPVLTRGWTWIP
jgi:hypothetical protein